LKDLSVIIVYYKGLEKLTRCLKSLQDIEDNRLSFEVIVVDNMSDDGSREQLIRQFPKFTFVSNSGNNGFANGCNLGAEKSAGSFLLFLNPDTTIHADALYEMLAEVRARPDCSVVSCSQLREDGTLDRPYGKFLTILTLTGWLRAIHRFFSGNMKDLFSQTENYIFPDWLSGSVIMISRKSFESIGKWDEDYWMYYEDVDLCRRAAGKNGEIVLLKNTVVGHTHGGSSRLNRKITVMTKTEVHKSRHVYLSKHERGARAFIMHLILILNNMILGLLPALAGLLLFFVRRLSIVPLIYLNQLQYYFKVLFKGTWLSERSVNYSK